MAAPAIEDRQVRGEKRQPRLQSRSYQLHRRPHLHSTVEALAGDDQSSSLAGVTFSASQPRRPLCEKRTNQTVGRGVLRRTIELSIEALDPPHAPVLDTKWHVAQRAQVLCCSKMLNVSRLHYTPPGVT